VLSKKTVFKQSLGVMITAGALGFGLFMGSAGPGRAQDTKAPAPPPGPQAKDQKEYDEASAAQKETDPKKKLEDLNKWKADYPTTELVDAREGMYLTTYSALGMAREAFDTAQEILKNKPTDLTALANAINVLMNIKPAPTPADLDTGEKDALTLLDNPQVFAPANKPPGQTDQQWAALQTQIKGFAEKVLLAIYQARKDDKRAVDDITKLINRDPNMATAAFELGSAMQRIIKATNTPENQPPMFWQFARALSITGPGALPAANKASVTKFLTDAYTVFHGNTDGLQDLLMQAKNSPFPPPGFTILSTVDIAKAKAAAEAKEQAQDPVYFLWVHQIKEPLLMDPSFWGMVMGTAAPPPAADGTSQYFKAHIISMTPATRPKEITVGIEKPDVADAKLTFDMPLPGKMDAGEVIQFKGTFMDFTKEPFMITFSIDDYKTDMNGTWTGKNVATKAGTKGKSTGKAATK
jgi:tetratricopeptide (TPR) repeat protein